MFIYTLSIGPLGQARQDKLNDLTNSSPLIRHQLIFRHYDMSIVINHNSHGHDGHVND